MYVYGDGITAVKRQYDYYILKILSIAEQKDT